MIQVILEFDRVHSGRTHNALDPNQSVHQVVVEKLTFDACSLGTGQRNCGVGRPSIRECLYDLLARRTTLANLMAPIELFSRRNLPSLAM
jgi:hypothetical protein